MSNSDEIVLAATMTSGPVSGGVAVVSTPEDLAKLVCKFALDCYKNDEFQSKMRLSDLFLSPDKRPGVTVTLGEHENDPFRFSEPFLGLWADYAANSEMLAPDSIKQYFPGHDLEHLIALAKQHPNYRMEWTSKTDENGHTTNTVKVEPLAPASSDPPQQYEIENASDDSDNTDLKPPCGCDDATQKESAIPKDDTERSDVENEDVDSDATHIRRSEHEQTMVHGKKHTLRQPTPEELAELDQAESVGKIMKVLQRAQRAPMTDDLVDELSSVSCHVTRVQGALAESLMTQLKSTYERAKEHIEEKKAKIAAERKAQAEVSNDAEPEPESSENTVSDENDDTRVRDLKQLMTDALPHIQRSSALDKLVPRVEELLGYVKELQEEVEHGKTFVNEIGSLIPQIQAAREESTQAHQEVESLKYALRKQNVAARIKIAKLENKLEQTKTTARIEFKRVLQVNQRLKQALLNHQRAVDSAHRMVKPTVELLDEHSELTAKHEQITAQKEEMASKFADLEKKLPKVLEKVRTLTAAKAAPRTTGLNEELAQFMNQFLKDNKRDALYSRIAGGDAVLGELFKRVENKYFSNTPSDGGGRF